MQALYFFLSMVCLILAIALNHPYIGVALIAASLGFVGLLALSIEAESLKAATQLDNAGSE